MLALKPNCECCDKDLPSDAPARICSFECTFCPDCAEQRLHGKCPNCGGALEVRPTRTGAALARHPASVDRHLRATPCPAAV
jgi:hypothetical protein